MFTNINIMPPENINGAYVPDAAMNRKVDIMDDQVDRMVRIVDILKTHTLIGAIFKYKLTTSRVFRLTLIFQRTYIILLFTGLFVTQVSFSCICSRDSRMYLLHAYWVRSLRSSIVSSSRCARRPSNHPTRTTYGVVCIVSSWWFRLSSSSDYWLYTHINSFA